MFYLKKHLKLVYYKKKKIAATVDQNKIDRSITIYTKVLTLDSRTKYKINAYYKFTVLSKYF